MEYTLTKETASLFDSIKHIDENGVEFWYGRELAPYLGYAQWRNFEGVIEKAKEACKSATGATENDFADVSKIVKAGATEKPVSDVKLTRYACYLVAQNGNPQKIEIAQAQTYFAIQTRYAEIQQMQEYQHLTTEEEMRLFLRRQMKEHNSQLADAAKNAGVKEPWEYARFQNAGYRGLYDGMDEDAIHRHKGLSEKERILDHMGSTELAANLFRANKQSIIHGIQNVIIVSIHCNAYGNGTTWTSPRGWSAYTSRGQTPADALATCLYNAAARNLPGMRLRKDTTDSDPDLESGFFILRHTLSPCVLTENLSGW